MLGGCLNTDMHAESGLLFVRSSSLFEPSATVVLLNGEPIPFAAGATGFEQITGLGAPIGAAAVRRPNRTRVSSVGGNSSADSSSDSAAGALGVGIGIGEGGDGGSGGDGGNGPPGHQRHHHDDDDYDDDYEDCDYDD